MSSSPVRTLPPSSALRRSSLLLSAALGCRALQQPAQLLRPGESRVVGGCLVERKGNMLSLSSNAEPENVQSEWDVSSGRAPD